MLDGCAFGKSLTGGASIDGASFEGAASIDGAIFDGAAAGAGTDTTGIGRVSAANEGDTIPNGLVSAFGCGSGSEDATGATAAAD